MLHRLSRCGSGRWRVGTSRQIAPNRGPAASGLYLRAGEVRGRCVPLSCRPPPGALLNCHLGGSNLPPPPNILLYFLLPCPTYHLPPWLCAQSRSPRNWRVGRKELRGRQGERSVVRDPKKRVCEEGWIWGKERNKVGSHSQVESNSCLFPAPLCPPIHQLLSGFLQSGRQWRGRDGKGKLSQDLGFLYFLLPEQRRGGKAGKGPRHLGLPDVGSKIK